MSDKYESGPKSTGGLWMNRNKQPNSKQPDMVGNVVITSQQLKALIEQHKANVANPDPDFELKLDIASWDRVARQSSQEYKYLSTEVSTKKKAGRPRDDMDFD